MREKKNDPRINNVKLDCQKKDSNDYVIEGQIMVSGLGGEIRENVMSVVGGSCERLGGTGVEGPEPWEPPSQ